MKTIIIILLFSSILLSCRNVDTTDKIKTIVKPNGDSLIVQIDKYGVYNGPFTAYYSNGTIATGFFKNNYRDSLYILYWPNGKSKLKTYYIYGKQEGVSYSFDLYDSTKNLEVFYRHDSVKIISKIICPSKELSQKVYEYYLVEDENWTYIGSLVFNNGKIDVSASSYYIVSPSISINKRMKFPLDKKSTISIDFLGTNLDYLVNMEKISLKGTESEKNIPFSVKKIRYGNSVQFNITIIPKKRGWYFGKGVIRVINQEMEIQRKVPVYFNYYVY